VDAYASWTLFFIFVSILILISGVVMLTHKKPESISTQRESGIALDATSGRQIPRTADGKTNSHEGVDIEDQSEDRGPVVWDVGEASDEEDEDITPTPQLQSLAEASRGEEGEHLMAVSPDDEDDMRSRTAANDRLPQTRRRSSSSVLRRDNDKDRDDGDEFGDFAGG
jgi:magnesium transporter